MIVDIWLAAGLSIYHISQSSVAASTGTTTSGFFPERRRPSSTASKTRSTEPEGKVWSHRSPLGNGGEDGESDDGGATDDDDNDLYAPGPLSPPIGSQPLQTLEKLQQMLDATDYMTESQHRSAETTAPLSSDTRRERRPAPSVSAHLPPPPPPKPSKLWLSGDRAKYKKLHHRLRQVETSKWWENPSGNKMHSALMAQPSTNVEKQPPPSSLLSDEEDDYSDATDDGLGYSLPDLPVYNSDAEDDGDLYAKEDERWNGQRPLAPPSLPFTERDYNSPGQIHPPPSIHRESGAPKTTQFHPNHSREQSSPATQYVQPQPRAEGPPPWATSSTPFFHPYNPYVVYPMQYSNHPNTAAFPPPMVQGYNPQQQTLYAPPVPVAGSGDDYSQPYRQQQTVPSLDDMRRKSTSPQLPSTARKNENPADTKTDHSIGKKEKLSPLSQHESGVPPSRFIASANSVTTLLPASSHILFHPPPFFPSQSFQESFLDDRFQQVQSLVEAGSRLSFASIQKISFMIIALSLLSYSAVSPRSLPLTEYNLQFYENVCLVCLSAVAPAFYMMSVFDARMNDINSVTNSFFVTFFLGYAGIFVAEIVVTTLLRLVIFLLFEREVFSLTPKVPIIVLPWVLREMKYRPKRITLFAADFAASCVVCPLIEECVKLLLLERTTSLPRNFKWVSKSSSKRKKKRRVAEAIVRPKGEQACINANQYVTHMLAVTLGLKLCDAGRRILLYTKSSNANKRFYAVCRGIFPIHDLCGAMTALALAKRDLLGLETPLWKLLAPAVVVHGMANFRGMKPIFKWNSATPWSEMQLSPLNIPDSSTFLQLMKKGYAKLMWLIVIGRVFGYCVKNYYLVNRQALKRTTKYAGNHAAFSAELATAELLKNQKKK